MKQRKNNKCENTIRIGSLSRHGCSRWRWVRRLMLLDRLLVRRYCLSHERCPRFNRKEDALEPWIIFILVITFWLESDVDISVNRHKLSQHVGILCVMNFAIL